jgi:FMN phosphatase YigB (HAD superfamily)
LKEILDEQGIMHFFDAAVFSSDIKFCKPNPKAFTTVLSQLGVINTVKAIYVSERSFEDIYGSQAVGMLTVALPGLATTPVVESILSNQTKNITND